jgi:hypothetical protein
VFVFRAICVLATWLLTYRVTEQELNGIAVVFSEVCAVYFVSVNNFVPAWQYY